MEISSSFVLTRREKEKRRKESDDDGVPAGGDRERKEGSSQLGRLTLSGRAGFVARHGGDEAACGFSLAGPFGAGVGPACGCWCAACQAEARSRAVETDWLVLQGQKGLLQFRLIELALTCIHIYFNN